MKLEAMEVEQHGKKFYLTQIKAKDLVDAEKIQVDYWRKNNKEGYQRIATPSRARAFSSFIKNAKSVSPVSILLSVRGNVSYKAEAGESFGTVTIPTQTQLWVVDGQHRIEGLRILLEQEPAYQDFEVPTIIFPLEDRYEEAKQFFIINRTQKGVKSDLAERFLSELAKREGPESLNDLPRIITRGMEWIPKATRIADILNAKGGCWKDKIRLPNETKKTAPSSIISQKAFTDSLESLLNNPMYADYNEEETAEILSRYWEAIKELCPESFDAPSEYVVQRTMGVAVLNKLLTSVINFCLSSEGQRLTKEKFKEVLSKMKEGMDSTYWHVDGTAGLAGTSKKSFSIITNKLRESLEKGNNERDAKLMRLFKL